MKVFGVILVLLAGALFLLAIGVVRNTVAPGLGTYLGAFAIPALVLWWGVKAIGKGKQAKESE